MWQLQNPDRVKLIIGILAANEDCMLAAVDAIRDRFGDIDLESETFPFDKTEYYKNQAGENILRKFVTLKRTIAPGRLTKIKLKTNRMEKELAEKLATKYPRPVNFDPGYIEPSKLVLASTKNFSHRIYIGKKIWAEVTLIYDREWKTFDYTFPDFRQPTYWPFFDKVRLKLREQLKSKT